MPGWKKRIFVRVVIARMEAEEITVDQALEDYTALTSVEKTEIKAAVELQLQG